MLNVNKTLKDVTNIVGLRDNEEHTLRRSRPLQDRFGTSEARLIGFHSGYSCQSLRLLTPGHVCSVGVPNNLSLTNVIEVSFLRDLMRFKGFKQFFQTTSQPYLKIQSSCSISESPLKRGRPLTISAKNIKTKNCILIPFLGNTIGNYFDNEIRNETERENTLLNISSLTENASNRPNIHRSGIVGGSQQYLWGPIP